MNLQDSVLGCVPKPGLNYLRKIRQRVSYLCSQKENSMSLLPAGPTPTPNPSNPLQLGNASQQQQQIPHIPKQKIVAIDGSIKHVTTTQEKCSRTWLTITTFFKILFSLSVYYWFKSNRDWTMKTWVKESYENVDSITLNKESIIKISNKTKQIFMPINMDAQSEAETIADWLIAASEAKKVDSDDIGKIIEPGAYDIAAQNLLRGGYKYFTAAWAAESLWKIDYRIFDKLEKLIRLSQTEKTPNLSKKKLIATWLLQKSASDFASSGEADAKKLSVDEVKQKANETPAHYFFPQRVYNFAAKDLMQSSSPTIFDNPEDLKQLKQLIHLSNGPKREAKKESYENESVIEWLAQVDYYVPEETFNLAAKKIISASATQDDNISHHFDNLKKIATNKHILRSKPEDLADWLLKLDPKTVKVNPNFYDLAAKDLIRVVFKGLPNNCAPIFGKLEQLIVLYKENMSPGGVSKSKIVADWVIERSKSEQQPPVIGNLDIQGGTANLSLSLHIAYNLAAINLAKEFHNEKENTTIFDKPEELKQFQELNKKSLSLLSFQGKIRCGNDPLISWVAVQPENSDIPKELIDRAARKLCTDFGHKDPIELIQDLETLMHVSTLNDTARAEKIADWLCSLPIEYPVKRKISGILVQNLFNTLTIKNEVSNSVFEKLKDLIIRTTEASSKTRANSNLPKESNAEVVANWILEASKKLHIPKDMYNFAARDLIKSFPNEKDKRSIFEKPPSQTYSLLKKLITNTFRKTPPTEEEMVATWLGSLPANSGIAQENYRSAANNLFSILTIKSESDIKIDNSQIYRMLLQLETLLYHGFEKSADVSAIGLKSSNSPSSVTPSSQGTDWYEAYLTDLKPVAEVRNPEKIKAEILAEYLLSRDNELSETTANEVFSSAALRLARTSPSTSNKFVAFKTLETLILRSTKNDLNPNSKTYKQEKAKFIAEWLLLRLRDDYLSEEVYRIAATNLFNEFSKTNQLHTVIKELSQLTLQCYVDDLEDLINNKESFLSFRADYKIETKSRVTGETDYGYSIACLKRALSRKAGQDEINKILKESPEFEVIFQKALKSDMNLLNKETKVIFKFLASLILEESNQAFAENGTSKKSPNEIFNLGEMLYVCNRLGGDDPHIFTTAHTLYDRAAGMCDKKTLDHVELPRYKVNMTDFDSTVNAVKAYKIRGVIAERIRFPASHRFYNFEEMIEAGTKEQTNPAFGAYFSNCDTGLISGGHFHATKRTTAGNKEIHFDFKTTYPGQIGALSAVHHLSEVGKGLEADPFFTNLTYSRGIDPLTGGNILLFEFPNIGKVIFHGDPNVRTTYRNIQVVVDDKLPKGEVSHRLHYMLSFLGCGSLLCDQRPEDEMRMRILSFFRSEDPKTAFNFERTEATYYYSIEHLKRGIIEEKSLIPKKELGVNIEEIYPGKEVWTSPELTQKMKQKGALGLMTGVSGDMRTLELILKDGLLSTKDRDAAGLIVKGETTRSDMRAGGGDQVYTRLITKNCKVKPSEFEYYGKFQVLIDLDAVKLGAYAYPFTSNGTKVPDEYSIRDNLWVFTNNLNSKDYNKENSLMVKNRIDSKYFRRIYVPNEQTKKEYIDYLIGKGIKKFNGMELDKFIVVLAEGNTFDPKDWDKP